jgi:hypothetical protein
MRLNSFGLGGERTAVVRRAGHTPDAPEAEILFEAGNKLLELEKTKGAKEARIKKIGDFDAIPEE